METELAAAVAQFGVAGLIGWMWLTERRASADRDKQLNDAHERILRDNVSLDTLLKALENNTRAMTALQAAHQRLTDLLLPSRRSPAGREAARVAAAPEPGPDGPKAGAAADRYDGR